LSTLRRNLIPNLLNVMALNLRHSQPEVRIFEVGKTYRTAGPGEYFEPRHVAGLVTGPGAEYSSAKGIVEGLMASLHINDLTFEPIRLHGMHPGRSASLRVGREPVGYVAEIDPDMVKAHLDVPTSVGRVAVFELASELLRELAVETDQSEYVPAPRFPALTRDLSLLFALDMPYGRVEDAVRSAAGELVESISLLSVYTGERVPANKKSVAVRLTLRACDRTLNDADADGVLSRVQAQLSSKLGGEARA
jgi:phenylalanyl-tRNA synthetase beta chain